VLFPKLTQLDLTGPFEVFGRLPDAQVLLVGAGEARSDTGLSLRPDVGFADAPQLEVLCVPGGPGVNAAMEDEALLSFLRDQASRAAKKRRRRSSSSWSTTHCRRTTPDRLGRRALHSSMPFPPRGSRSATSAAASWSEQRRSSET